MDSQARLWLDSGLMSVKCMALVFVTGSSLPICCICLIDCVEKDLGRESRAEVARIFWLLDFVPLPETIDIIYYWQVLSEHSWDQDPLYECKTWRADLDHISKDNVNDSCQDDSAHEDACHKT